MIMDISMENLKEINLSLEDKNRLEYDDEKNAENI